MNRLCKNIKIRRLVDSSSAIIMFHVSVQIHILIFFK